MNRSNPAAEENYAYFFNNGSQQLQRVQEVYVGNQVRYSTHLENPDPAYAAMKDQPALTVEIISAGINTPYTFTLAELESILYGPGVSKRDRDTDGRQEKGYYYYKNAGDGDKIEDLFEGVNLGYLLTEHIGLQGTLGSVEIYSGANTEPSGVYDLSVISEKSYVPPSLRVIDAPVSCLGESVRCRAPLTDMTTRGAVLSRSAVSVAILRCSICRDTTSAL